MSMMTDLSPSGGRSAALHFLFTDIEGSTARWEAQRDAMSVALPRHDAILRAAIEGRGGTVFKTVGDAFCAVFADGSDALAAAIDAQTALAAEDWSACGPDFAPLLVRMGIHVGRAEARGGDYFGPALNRTARLMAAGHGGQVLLSLAAQQLLRDYLPEGVQLRDLGEHRLKDLRHSEHLWQVVTPGLADVAKAPTTAEALRPVDRIVVAEVEGGDGGDAARGRPLPERLRQLLEALRSDSATVVLSAEEAREIARHHAEDLTTYRLGRVAEWSQPRYRVDGRFVALTLLVDQGEDAAGERWTAKQERHADLGALLAATGDPALVLLGPPGAGKSTLLRRLELEQAMAGLREEADCDRVTFYVHLNQYKGERPGQAPPLPGEWLAARWSERNGSLPGLDDLLGEGRLMLLLDGLNEMPTGNEREFRERVGWWKDWLQRLAATGKGNRVLFSCRSLDYSATLSSTALRVPQVQIEPLSDEQVRDFLRLYSPLRGDGIWAAIAGTSQLEALRAPYFLALLVDQVEGGAELAGDRAGLFTGFVRRALKRELERDNPLFVQEAILTERDLRRVVQWQWRDGYELPERGLLFPKLGSLAFRMQEGAADGGASQLRVDYDQALDLIDDASDETILKAGLALSVLDEDPAADEVLYRHQLLQEFFAGRMLAKAPQPDLVAAPWRKDDIQPGVAELMATLPPSEALPPLPQTGWEETTVLAAAMTTDVEAFLGPIMERNLVVAGRAARLPAVWSRLGTDLRQALRSALLARGRDPAADLRHRIACLEVLGELGDPRWERRQGPDGAYLLGPMVSIPGGKYPIGDDEVIAFENRGRPEASSAHVPRHEVTVAPFRLAVFPVTNAEYACFIAAGGYQEERWWQTEDARRWLRGEAANEGALMNNRYWRQRYLSEEGLLERMEAEGGFVSEEAVKRWKHWVTLDDAAFEAALQERWKGTAATEPAFWRDTLLNGPTQPVTGVCWFEARAYAAWLAAQTGEGYRLPSEVEWEAGARGQAARTYAWGDTFTPERCNTQVTLQRRSTPVGAFVEGDSPEGLADLTGNVMEWTSSLFGVVRDADEGRPTFAYPYAADDGREDPAAPIASARVLRGGSSHTAVEASRTAYRYRNLPVYRSNIFGFRLAAS